MLDKYIRNDKIQYFLKNQHIKKKGSIAAVLYKKNINLDEKHRFPFKYLLKRKQTCLLFNNEYTILSLLDIQQKRSIV